MHIKIQEISAEQTYDLRHIVMYPDLPFDYIKLPKDHEGVHFGVFKNNIIVTVVSLFIEGNSAQFRKLATAESEQGNGYASTLLNYIIAYSKERQCENMWCNARANKTSYYKKFGFIETNKTYAQAGIDFIVLEKVLSKKITIDIQA